MLAALPRWLQNCVTRGPDHKVCVKKTRESVKAHKRQIISMAQHMTIQCFYNIVPKVTVQLWRYFEVHSARFDPLSSKKANFMEASAIAWLGAWRAPGETPFLSYRVAHVLLPTAMLAFLTSIPLSGCRSSFLASSRKVLKNRPVFRSSSLIIRAISTNGVGDESEGGEEGRVSGADVRNSRVNDLRERLDRLDASDPRTSSPRAEQRAKRYLERKSQLIWIATVLPGSLADDCSDYLDNPFRKLTAATLAILFGFFAATSASTIIGSVADWDPLAAAVLLVWTETFTRLYYKSKDKSLLLRLANAFKIGLTYGMAVDAFKLST